MARGRFNFGIGSGGFPGDFQLFQLDLASGEHRTLTREIIDLTLAIGQAARARDGATLESKTDRWRFRLPDRTDWGMGVHLGWSAAQTTWRGASANCMPKWVDSGRFSS
jgi:alkanesulfonate monooxygenase SsuD/methylene tetrahydromethanopterin reductase-like flavin-dependent oxidoreductase (luciferase family)